MLRYALLLLLLTFAVACGGSDNAGSTSGEADVEDDDGMPAGMRQKYSADQGTATVKGAIKFEGKARARATDMGSDKYCTNCYKDGAKPKSETYIVGANGEMANVFVYIKDGLSGWKFGKGTSTVNVRQDKCVYVPHVVGMQVGDTLKITNDDSTMHNIHSSDIERGGDWFNQAQPNKGDVYPTTAERAGFYSMKCDVHGWMQSYICIVKNPFYSVSGADGGFSLANLPAGTYTIAAWHEKLDEQVQTVTVKDGETTEISFTFKK